MACLLLAVLAAPERDLINLYLSCFDHRFQKPFCPCMVYVCASRGCSIFSSWLGLVIFPVHQPDLQGFDCQGLHGSCSVASIASISESVKALCIGTKYDLPKFHAGPGEGQRACLLCQLPQPPRGPAQPVLRSGSLRLGGGLRQPSPRPNPMYAGKPIDHLAQTTVRSREQPCARSHRFQQPRHWPAGEVALPLPRQAVSQHG